MRLTAVWLVGAISLAGAGCLSDTSGRDVRCVYDIRSATPPAERHATEVSPFLTEDFEARHPSLASAFRNLGTNPASGGDVSCDEGIRAMGALAELGVDVRVRGPFIQEAYVLYRNSTYQVYLTTYHG